jgi:hypothetical protein
MLLKDLWQRCLGRLATGPRPGPTALRRRGLRLTVEQLEERTCPSTFKAATVSDLIADIKAANLAGGQNTITLTAPTAAPYVLTVVDNGTDGANGLPVIAANDNLTIAGNGDTIARKAVNTPGGTPAFRLFDVALSASLTLQNLTLQGGWATGAGVFAEGGAIYNHDQATLDLNGVTVQNNIAQGVDGRGGPAAGGGIFSSGTLTLEGGTTVQNNEALGGAGARSVGGPGGGAYGGGVYVAAGTFIVTSATLSANTAHGGGGGPGYSPFGRVRGGPGGNASGGGVCVAAGTAIVTSATLSRNVVQGGQGGPGTASGGSAGNGFGGGLVAAGGTVTLRNDTVTGNSADGGQGGPHQSGGNGCGGGVYVAAGMVTVTSTTLSGNVAHGGQGGYGGIGGNGLGGGMDAAGGTVTLRNDTVMGNSADGGKGGVHGGGPGQGQGGGLFIDPLAAVSLDVFTRDHVRHNTASTSHPNIDGSYSLLP